MKTKLLSNDIYLLLIEEEAEIKENGLFIGNNKLFQSDPDEWLICKCESIKGANYLMCDGVGYTKGYNAFSLIAYYPLTKEAKELDLPLLPPFGEVSVENLALKAYHIDSMETLDLPPFEDTKNCVEGFIKGYKAAQQAKQYSLDDMKKAIEMARTGYGWDGNINVVDNLDNDGYGGCVDNFDKEFKFKSEEEIIQSLTTQRMPSEFIPELVIISNDKVYFDKQLKTITNSEGKQELVGIWKY